MALALAVACEDRSYRDIGADIRVLTTREDALVAPATQRLARWRQRALPQIETAMHTASPTGKLHLVHALLAIGDGQAIPILRHFAIYDASPEVRLACEALLQRWAGTSTGEARGELSRAALAAVADRRARGEGPVIVGEATAR